MFDRSVLRFRFYLTERRYTCGSTTDLDGEGLPIGAIRVSFGYMSTVADADALLSFISDVFVERSPTSARLLAVAAGDRLPAASAEETRVGEGLSPPKSVSPVRLSKIRVFPIKSCGAHEVDRWEINEQGLLYDRGWMVVNVYVVSLSTFVSMYIRDTTTFCAPDAVYTRWSSLLLF